MLARMGRITAGLAAPRSSSWASRLRTATVQDLGDAEREAGGPEAGRQGAEREGLVLGHVVESGKKATLKWKLSYSHLSGKATAAHIHLGKRGVAGNVLVAALRAATAIRA